MNEVEAYQVCNSAISALSHGETSLSTFPKLLRRIIAERAWESRRVPGKGVVTMQSLRELVTTPPVTGWGEDPAKIEAVIRDDAEVLAMWREAMKGRAGRPKADEKTRRNPTQLKTDDRGRAYDLSRLQRKRPDLFARVAAGEISANAAAIEAGFRRRKTQLEKAIDAMRALSVGEREEVARQMQDTPAAPAPRTSSGVKIYKHFSHTTPFSAAENEQELAEIMRLKYPKACSNMETGAEFFSRMVEQVEQYEAWRVIGFASFEEFCRKKLGKTLREVEQVIRTVREKIEEADHE
jgi:hypothetical protein